MILTASLAVASAAPGDAGEGRDIFARRCSGCHSPDSDKEGPALRGIFGRKAGTALRFPYSAALQNSGVVWSDSALDRWLQNQAAMVPGTAMEFKVENGNEREVLIAYLKTLKGVAR